MGALLSIPREPHIALRTLDGAHLNHARRPLLRFIHNHGDGRITRKAREWLRHVRSEAILRPGQCIVTASSGSQLLGLLLVAGFGEQVMAIVVHKKMRKQKLGQRLVRHALHHVRTLKARVAVDNPASIGMCFAAGMVAVALERGVTGKPTLIFVANSTNSIHR